MLYTYQVGTLESLMSGSGVFFSNYVDASKYATKHSLQIMEYQWEYSDSYIVDQNNGS